MSSKTFQFDLRGFCQLHAISFVEFSQMTGITPRRVLDLLKGRKAGGSTRRRIARLLLLFDEFAEEIYPPFGPWLRKPNRAFDGLSPIQVLAQGKERWIWTLLEVVGSGQPI